MPAERASWRLLKAVRESISHPGSGILVPNASPQEFGEAVQKFTSNSVSQEQAMNRLEAEMEWLLKPQP